MRFLRLVRFLPLLSLAILPIPARSVELSIPGIPNFHQVNPRLYRGAQPSADAWPKLATLGIKTVIDLRRESEHSIADEAKAVEAAGMRYVSFPMDGFATPTAEQMARVLGLVDTGDTVFVHCKLGMDRTGSVVAAYRIAREGWENPRALAEANSLGLHWYSQGMKRFIRSYQVTEPALAQAAEAAQAADSTGTPAITPATP